MKSAKLALALSVCAALLATVGAGSAAAAFGIENFSTIYQDPNGVPGEQLLQAGSHPDVVTTIDLNTAANGNGQIVTEGTLRDIEVNLPAGFSGNPQAAEQCVMEDLVRNNGVCNTAAQVGVISIAPSGDTAISVFPVYNMKAPDEQTAVLAAVVVGVPTKIVFSARTDGDYGLTGTISRINEALELTHTKLTVWGVPAAPLHDPLRVKNCYEPACGNNPAGIPPRPFLSLPTRCEPMVTELRAGSWQDPGAWVTVSEKSPPLTGCENLDFMPNLQARPTTNVADSPTGLDLRLNLPQNADDPDGLASANLRSAEVGLPEGLVINPAGANGLGACTPQQVGYIGPRDERQFVRYPMPRTGSFTIGFSGQSTPPISAAAGIAQVTQAVEALPGLAGNVVVSGGPGSWSFTFIGALTGVDVPLLTATATDNRTASVTVTGDGGGFNLLAGADTTAAVSKASFGAGQEFINNPGLTVSRRLSVGELIEGPGIAPGTTIAYFFQSASSAFFILNQPTTSDQTEVELKTQLNPDISAAGLETALQSMSSLGNGNVLVTDAGTSGDTHAFDVLFVGELAGTEPVLTAESSLTGPGAGVAIASKSLEAKPLEVSVAAQAGVPTFDKSPARCPDASKIGSVEVDTPAFPDPLKGSVYTMTPYENPFASLLGIYFTVEGHGIIAKIPARVSADPQTGRLTNVVTESPQLPIENVRLKLDGGAAAVLRTPGSCGTYATTSKLTPWSFPATPGVDDKDTYAITQAPPGGSCASGEAQRPNAPAFQGGSVAPIAGTYQPFVVNLKREDGTQQFAAVTLTPPPGLVAKLKGTAICGDAALAAAAGKTGKQEEASSSCPVTSAVGSVYAQAGAGPAPYNAPGKVYLAGPYKGAPLSLATVIPATAGPFDLGTVVTRIAVAINPKTAQVTARSDPLPQILKGIPLDVRSVSVRLDKPDFSLNPTSCDPMAVKGTLLSTAGAGAALDNRFQLAECGRLKFKPKLSFSLKGKTTRSGHPALTAVLKPRPGDANIASVSVALPHSEFLAQNHIRTVCTRVQFAADACPKGSIYGKVSVVTPILDEPLTGPVYLRSSSNPLPDMVVDLHGPANQPIRFEAAGRIDSVNGGIRNTFDFVPDVPFTKLTLQLQGAKKGLLENSRDICKSTNRAQVSYAAHNGASYSIQPQLKASCGKKARKGKAKKKSKRG